MHNFMIVKSIVIALYSVEDPYCKPEVRHGGIGVASGLKFVVHGPLRQATSASF